MTAIMTTTSWVKRGKIIVARVSRRDQDIALRSSTPEDVQPAEREWTGGAHRRHGGSCVDVVEQEPVVAVVDRRRTELVVVVEQRLDVIEHRPVRPAIQRAGIAEVGRREPDRE